MTKEGNRKGAGEVVQVQVGVTDNRNGSYTAKFVAHVAGLYKPRIWSAGVPISMPPEDCLEVR